MQESVRELNYFRMRNSIQFKQMNEWQKEAILRTKGPLLVVAGPGSGKTHVITYRVLNLVTYEKVSPQNVYVITFTKEAARSMGARFHHICRTHMADDSISKSVSFGTYHSLFFQIIKSHEKYKNVKLIGEEGKKAILADIWKRRYSECLNMRVLNDLLQNISFYKNTGNIPSNEDAARFNAIYREFELYKNTMQGIDFDDMILLCKDLLEEDAAFCESWQKRMEYILVDEFQDTGTLQYDVLCLLAAKHQNICVVGDDDQAIYGFRGSRPDIMFAFMQDFPKCTRIDLPINYRSLPGIVRAAGNVVSHNKKRLIKTFMPYRSEDEQCVFLHEFENREKMGAYVMDALRRMGKEELSRCAVLFRTNSRLNFFAAVLAREEIPYVSKERCTSVYEHFIAKDIMDYLKASKGIGGRGVLLSVLNKPRNRIGREALFREDITPKDIVTFYEAKGKTSQEYADAVRFANGMRILGEMNLSQGITFICRYFGYEAYLRQKSGKDSLLLESFQEVLTFLKEDAAHFTDIRDWEMFQYQYNEKNRRTSDNYYRKENAEGVHIMTLHGAKGLEFERVFIFEVNEENIPKKRKGESLSREALEEERRLFYVGMTRAKKTLELLYTLGSESSPKSPSRFLNELEC